MSALVSRETSSRVGAPNARPHHDRRNQIVSRETRPGCSGPLIRVLSRTKLRHHDSTQRCVASRRINGDEVHRVAQPSGIRQRPAADCGTPDGDAWRHRARRRCSGLDSIVAAKPGSPSLFSDRGLGRRPLDTPCTRLVPSTTLRAGRRGVNHLLDSFHLLSIPVAPWL